MSETLVRITGTTAKGVAFCAGVVLMRGQVVRAAPILKWTLGWEAAKLSAYCRDHGWPASQRRYHPSDKLTQGENEA